MGMTLNNLITGAANMTNAHKRIIAELLEQNPRASLEDIAQQLNNMPEMMSCHLEITADILTKLGHPARPPIASCEADVADASLAHRTLSVELLRKQLERRHAKIQDRIEMLLEEETISQGQLKTVEMLAKIDDGICTKLLDLMNQEATPTLPQAIIITCMRRHGVPDADIQVIESFRVA